MKIVKGTAKTDKFTVNEVNVIVVTAQKSKTETISKNGNNKIFGAAAKDTFTVKGGKRNYIYGDKGNDTITVTGKIGTGNKIYGDDEKNKVTGKDTFNINAGKKNYFYGGKGVDTFNINGGTTNYLYGGAGKDTYIFGKKKATATIKDYAAGQDTLKVNSGVITSTTLKDKNVTFKAGNASITVAGAATKTISLKDSRGSYTASNTAIKLGKDFKGTMDATKYLSTVKTVDGRNAAKSVSITGNVQNNTIYAGKGGGMLNGGAGNDTITINDGTQVSGNSYTLRGGTGTDNYVINSAFIADTKISINQSDFNSGDADVLTLSKVNKNDVTYRLDSGTLTVTHKSGGTVSVAGWGANPLSKIEFADGGSITGGEINESLNPSPSYRVIEINSTGTYQGSNSQEIFRFSGNGWNATVRGADSKDLLDFSNYKDGTYDFDNVCRSGDDLIMSFVRKTGSQDDEVVGTVTIKDYFVTDNKIADVRWYNDSEKKTETMSIVTKCNSNGSIYGTPQRDWIIPEESTKLVFGKESNDRINVVGGSLTSIYGEDGDDIITVTGGNHRFISGGEGDDVIVIRNNASFSSIDGGSGKNNITVADGASVDEIWADSEEDNSDDENTITIKKDAGNVSVIKLYSGTNTVNIAGGTNGENGLTITNSREEYSKGPDIINVSVGNVTIIQTKKSESHVTVNWSDDFGELAIRPIKYNGDLDRNNKSLTIKGAKFSDFTIASAEDASVNANCVGISLTDKTNLNSKICVYWGAFANDENSGLDYWCLNYGGITFDDGFKTTHELRVAISNQ